MVSIHRPLGYRPSTLPLHHSASCLTLLRAPHMWVYPWAQAKEASTCPFGIWDGLQPFSFFSHQNYMQLKTDLEMWLFQSVLNHWVHNNCFLFAQDFDFTSESMFKKLVNTFLCNQFAAEVIAHLLHSSSLRSVDLKNSFVSSVLIITAQCSKPASFSHLNKEHRNYFFT